MVGSVFKPALGLVALASSEQTVLEVDVYAELVGRAQMTNTDEVQEAPWSAFLARPLHSKKRGEWNYEHRRATAAVLPPGHTHRYARRASFPKRHTSEV